MIHPHQYSAGAGVIEHPHHPGQEPGTAGTTASSKTPPPSARTTDHEHEHEDGEEDDIDIDLDLDLDLDRELQLHPTGDMPSGDEGGHHDDLFHGEDGHGHGHGQCGHIHAGTNGELPDDLRAAIEEVQKFPGECEGEDGEGSGRPTMKKGARSAEAGDGCGWAAHHARCGGNEEPFNPNSYTTFNFKLRKLYNLKSASTEATGDYIVRICFMGRVLGEYTSGPVDLVSLTQLSRHSLRISKYLHCPSLILGHELSMHLRYRDLLDNPVLLTLALGGTTEEGEPHPPFAYTCLNVLEFVKKGVSKANKVIQLWILLPERTPTDRQHVCGFPLISLDILGFTGLPTQAQLKHGNIMSVIIESMYRLPASVLKLAQDPDILSHMDIHFQLPYTSSEFESTMVFPGGQFRKMVSGREEKEVPAEGGEHKNLPHTTKSSTTEFSPVSTAPPTTSVPGTGTGTASGAEGRNRPSKMTKSKGPDPLHPPSTSSAFNMPLPDSVEPKPIGVSEGVPVYKEERSLRHWASVLDYFPDAPYAASISGKQKIPRVSESIEAIGDIEKAGESWRKHLTSTDTRIVWNSLHRHYIGIDTYKQMLEKLSKQTIWPLEVAITIQQELSSQKSKTNSEKSASADSGASVRRKSHRHSRHSHAHSSATPMEMVVIYHGVAFVDMTHLLYPGVNRARFIQQIFPFNEVLFRAKTHAMNSAFLQTIRHSIDHKGSHPTGGKSAAGDSPAKSEPQRPSSHQRQAQKSVVSNATAKSRPSQQPQHHQAANSHSHQQHGQHHKPGDSRLTSKDDLSGVRIALLNESQMSDLPFIIFNIRLRRPLVPAVETIPSGAVKKLMKDGVVAKFPRKKLMTSILADKQFQASVLEAAAELSHEFHTAFLDSIIKDGAAQAYLDPNRAASSVATIKKHFLFHLIASEKYAELRGHLNRAVTGIIEQNAARLQPKGLLDSKRKYQQFLHNLFSYLVEKMHHALSSAATGPPKPIQHHEAGNDVLGKSVVSVAKLRGSKKSLAKAKTLGRISKKEEHAARCARPHSGPGDAGRRKRRHGRGHKHKRRPTKKAERRRRLAHLLMFAQEAFEQGDVENSHRIHVERIARSGDSSNCWADFAVMWLARGDDRLAEVALREALLTNSKNIKALIISGMIAARHCDSRAITCLGAALNLRPNAPELMVLLAIAHSCLGNEIASEYFFKKARYVHHLLTGQNVSEIEEQFQEIAARLPKDMLHVHASALENERAIAAKLSHQIKQESAVEHDIDPDNANGDSEPPAAAPTSAPGSQTPSQIFRFNENEHGGGAITTLDAKYITYSGQEEHEALLKGKRAAHAHAFGQHYHFNAQSPGFRFASLSHEVKAVPKFRLPSMGPCLIQTWNVTKRSKSELVEQEHKQPAPKLATAEEITRAFDQVATGTKPPQEHGHEHAHGAPSKEHEHPHVVAPPGSEDVTQIWVNPHQAQANAAGVSPPKTHVGATAEHIGEYETSGEGEGAGTGAMRAPQVEHNPEHTDVPQRKSKTRLITRRVGSELLWTAHLLLKLRLFDFLDGVLARELAFNPERSVTILYLRALSLYLRGREGEAIGFVQEAIEKEPKAVALWALLGHCYYRLKMHTHTFESYEKALKLPHGKQNLQLVYLRFGIQCLERGLLNLAKKVFRKGARNFPSPYMWLALGNTCYLMKEYSEAEAAYAEANRLDNTNPIVWAHLSLVSWALGDKTISEHAYRWAIRFGLKKGSRLMNELEQLHQDLGSPELRRIPDCIPQQYYLQRLGKENPLEEYKEALKFFDSARPDVKDFENSEREEELIRRLQEGKPVIDRSILDQLAKVRQDKLEASQKKDSVHKDETVVEVLLEEEQEMPSEPVPEEVVVPPPEDTRGRTQGKAQGKGKASSKSKSRTGKKRLQK